MARAGAMLLRQADVLVPVPLHRHRLFLRRYNQAGDTGARTGAVVRKPTLPDALVRRRATASLGAKSAVERASEVADAFAVRASRVVRLVGRRVLLIDDVMTSGATANACALALLAAGAAAVDVLVAARGAGSAFDVTGRRSRGTFQTINQRWEPTIHARQQHMAGGAQGRAALGRPGSRSSRSRSVPWIIEASGFDYCMIDHEHGAFDLETIADLAGWF